MNPDFFKFPTTPHLLPPGDGEIRGDKLLSPSERAAFLEQTVIVEEKVDGANLGISFDVNGNIRVQNRGDYLNQPLTGQWKKLTDWLQPRLDSLFETLSDRYILFGEWCYARHSVFYELLPDWFLAFDVYDKQERKFLSVARRNRFLAPVDVCLVPFIGRGVFQVRDLREKIQVSRLGTQPAEGLYLRIDSADWLLERAKLVRSCFSQNMEQHWSRGGIRPNRLREQG